jgi:LmbE family N-acetylglucosaminyl deacetylase
MSDGEPSRAAGKRILVVTAHPDDADVLAGGTMARWADEGHALHLAVLTRGDKGHRDPAITPERVRVLREAEQRAAASVLGVSEVTFLDFEDGELAWAARELAETAARLVRQHRPDVVLTLDPFAGAPGYSVAQLHPDHRAVGAAVVEACYFRAPVRLYYPAHAEAGLAPHRPEELLLIMSDHADHAIDISATFERKVRAVREHASQFGHRQDLDEWLRGLGERAGRPFGLPLAESFKRLAPR